MTFDEMIDFILSQPNTSVKSKGMFIEDVHYTTQIQKTTIETNINNGINPKKSASCLESKNIIEKIYKEMKQIKQ